MEISPVAMSEAGVWTYSEADENEARARLERLRWPEGIESIECPYCSVRGKCFRVTVGRLDLAFGVTKSRPGMAFCGKCRCEFTVTSWTHLHGTRLPLCCWIRAVESYCETDGGITARDLMYQLTVAWKSAWRIRKTITAAVGDERNKYKWARGGRSAREVEAGEVDAVLAKLLATVKTV